PEVRYGGREADGKAFGAPVGAAPNVVDDESRLRAFVDDEVVRREAVLCRHDSRRILAPEAARAGLPTHSGDDLERGDEIERLVDVEVVASDVREVREWRDQRLSDGHRAFELGFDALNSRVPGVDRSEHRDRFLTRTGVEDDRRPGAVERRD